MFYPRPGNILKKHSNSNKLSQSLFLLLLICFNLSSGQTMVKENLVSITDVENYIVENYHPDSVQVINLCQNSCVFIRFEISKDGKVTNLAFNKNIPVFIIKALGDAFKKMEKRATFSEALLSSRKTYLLPFIYNYQSGCTTFYNKDQFSIYKKDLAGNTVDDEQQGSAIINILNFRDKELKFLDCIILPPVRTGNMTESGFR